MLTYVKRWKKGSNESNQPARDLKRFASQPEQREQGRSSGFLRDYSRLTCSAECPATSDDYPLHVLYLLPSGLPRPYWTRSGPRNRPNGTGDDPKESFSLQKRRFSTLEGRFHNEGGDLRCCFRGGIKGQFNHAACQTRREEAAATDAAGQKASAQAGSRRGRRPETHLLLHLCSSQICPLRARATPGETASIN